MLTFLFSTILLLPPPGGQDNGFITAPGCPTGLAWPTLPLNLYFDPIAANGVDVAMEHWNESPLSDGLGDVVFYGLPPDPDPRPYSVVVYVPVNPSAFPDGAIFIGQSNSDPCSIGAVFVLLPDSSLPNLQAKLVNLLGQALGLAPDMYGYSVMDPRFTTDNLVFSRVAEITDYDVTLILDRIVL